MKEYKTKVSFYVILLIGLLLIKFVPESKTDIIPMAWSGTGSIFPE